MFNGIKCYFCHRLKDESIKMIANNDMNDGNKFICQICINKCYELFKSHNQNNFLNKLTIPTPTEIYNALIKKIAGQEQAIKTISTVVYNHYKNVKHNKDQQDNNSKFHSLVMGPTGSGKTMIFENISKLLNVPCVIVDATTLTSVGYAGYDCDSTIKLLYEESGHNKDLCEMGIVVVDEFDKCRKQINSNHKDVSGEAVQFGFLKLLDGKEVSLESNKKNPFENNKDIKINTKNILFVFCGAFSGLTDIIKNETSSIDLILQKTDNNKRTPQKANYNNLIDYGIISELVGRFYYVINCKELTKADLKDIIYNKDNSILDQYKHILYLDDKIKLDFTEDSIDLIIHIAYGRCGVRSLRNIFNKILEDVMFDVENMRNQKYLVTKEYIESLCI